MTNWPDKKVGEAVAVESYRVFVIEAVWAYPNEPMQRLKWSSYYAHAYRDRATGKPFTAAHADVCEGRVVWGRGDRPERTFFDSLAFYDLDKAVACMKRLEECAEWSTDYEGPEEWRVKRRGRPIIFRVVEINHAETHLVVA
jgi:hypothetical protein